MDLEAIKNRAEKATPGPWEPCYANNGNCKCGLIWSVPFDTVVCANPCRDDLHIYFDGEQQKNNAEFIAHARTDIPSLLLYICVLKKELEETKKTRDDLKLALKELVEYHDANYDDVPVFYRHEVGMLIENRIKPKLEDVGDKCENS